MEKFLTLEWNNRLSLSMGLLFFSFIAVVMLTGTPITSQIFTPLVLIGCMF